MPRFPALDAVDAADASLARVAHPSTMARYPDVTRDRLRPAVTAARAAVAGVRAVLDTSPGSDVPDYRPETRTG